MSLDESADLVFVITCQDWRESVAKWIKIFRHPRKNKYLITQSCGFCEAKRRSNLEEGYCDPCPAFPEMCQNLHVFGNVEPKSALERAAKHKGNSRIVRAESRKILKWLKEFGEIAGWRNRRLENLLRKLAKN